MASGEGEGSTEDYEALMSMTDVALLKSAWRQEKAAAEILQFERALIGRVGGLIQLMEETVEDLTESGFDPLTVSLYQMDLDRTQFLLRSYLQIRLQKIEKYRFHIFSIAELLAHLSKEEKWFIERCCVDLQTHLEKSILSRLPYTYQSIFQQSIINDGRDMDSSNDIASQKSLEEPFEMEPNVVYFVRYKAVKKFVEEGKIDLY